MTWGFRHLQWITFHCRMHIMQKKSLTLLLLTASEVQFRRKLLLFVVVFKLSVKAWCDDTPLTSEHLGSGDRKTEKAAHPKLLETLCPTKQLEFLVGMTIDCLD